jgi:SAM-dependent methyltransferase
MLGRAALRARELGAEASTNLQLVEADVLAAPRDGDGRFGLAILALNSILLFADRGDQARVVARMAALLGPGGIAVIDAWQPQPDDLVRLDGRLSLEWLRDDPPGGRQVAKIASGWYDAGSRVVTLVTLFDEAAPGGPPARWTRTDRLRLVSADELVEAAEGAGLEIERLAGDYELGPFGPSSERAVVVARKPG